MFKKVFKIDFKSEARTVNPSIIGDNPSGWYVEGEVIEDYYEWVNDFRAIHKDYGIVIGNFEKIVCATSKTAFDKFLKDHPYSHWDYYDI